MTQITKTQIDRWFDEGQKPLSKEQKKDIQDLAISLNNLSANIRKIKFEKVPSPLNWKVKKGNYWFNVITGFNYPN